MEAFVEIVFNKTVNDNWNLGFFVLRNYSFMLKLLSDSTKKINRFFGLLFWTAHLLFSLTKVNPYDLDELFNNCEISMVISNIFLQLLEILLIIFLAALWQLLGKYDLIQ